LSDTSARDRYLAALMSHVAEDQYPSATQMRHIETMLDRDQIEDYLGILIDKIAEDRYPSVPMMQRIEKVLDDLR
jgi:uncharacterized membrane-anchored protein YjiN (DUF445 family)